jgi:hypothetical protein
VCGKRGREGREERRGGGRSDVVEFGVSADRIFLKA